MISFNDSNRFRTKFATLLMSILYPHPLIYEITYIDKNDFHLFIYNTIIWKADSPPCQEFKQGMNAIQYTSIII